MRGEPAGQVASESLPNNSCDLVEVMEPVISLKCGAWEDVLSGTIWCGRFCMHRS